MVGLLMRSKEEKMAQVLGYAAGGKNRSGGALVGGAIGGILGTFVFPVVGTELGMTFGSMLGAGLGSFFDE
jgi:hypothetical protein